MQPFDLNLAYRPNDDDELRLIRRKFIAAILRAAGIEWNPFQVGPQPCIAGESSFS